MNVPNSTVRRPSVRLTTTKYDSKILTILDAVTCKLAIREYSPVKMRDRNRI